MGAVALLFNPVFPVYLSRGFWTAVDLIAAVVFWISGSELVGASGEGSTEEKEP